MRRICFAIVLIALAMPGAAHAVSDGCVAVGSHSFIPPQPWQCRYTATGPGLFVAATTNPYVIYAEREGVPGKIILSSRSVPGRPRTGKLDTRGGDLVHLSISCWDYAASSSCDPGNLTGGRDGALAAQSFL